ncbi:hypothetical protein HK099_005725 [Clydaea vesicula]|uniref:glutaminase n=1 Tax=Clydaea vesicula TaxID=447962 RepID=A0AAD5XYB4_9FUNG|nr:hypothetical protein HK099_005725 [Clydaea vesicula]KAJ3384955.1 hypothetical protein HDU92_003306 [Lobulomyces angularis]
MKSHPLKIGILSIQGAFLEHINVLTGLSDEYNLNIIEVKTSQQLHHVDGLILPGGESTTMALIAKTSDLFDELVKFVHNPNKIVWGTCAGLIFLSSEISYAKIGGQDLLKALKVKVSRNAFGKQLGSFSTQLKVPCLLEPEKYFPAVFIRAPIVESIDENSKTIEVLAYLENLDAKRVRGINHVEGEKIIVAVRQDNIIATSFHPELTRDDRFHRFFLELVKEKV